MRVGIITYHSAYNFGSVLQAYATQQIVNKIGCKAEIINYRMDSQKEFYAYIHHVNNFKSFIKYMMTFGKRKALKRRAIRFEEFIKENLNLTDEFSGPEEAYVYSETFDIYISGSDQIWNKHSNELKNVDLKYMDPYFLTFTKKHKISYASSVVNMTDSELLYVAKKIKDFSHISCREQDSADKIAKLINRNVETVLDPTLLLSNFDWEKIMCRTKIEGKPYLLLYTLATNNHLLKILGEAKKKAREYDLQLVVLAPLATAAPNIYRVKFIRDAGPKEFMRLVYDSKYIITDSYHGTLFSINFQKQFFSMNSLEKSDNRVYQILDRLNLRSRIINYIMDANFTHELDYSKPMYKLEEYKNESISYLRRSLNMY